MKHAMSKSCVLAVSAFFSAAALADKPADTMREGGPIPPTIRASEDTIINYPGGTPPANVVGALDADDSTYNRLLSGCGALSASGTAVSYDTITLTNTGSSTATLNVQVGDPADPTQCTGLDTYVSVYDSVFNPADPTTGCLASDDDSGPGFCSLLTGVSVPAASTVVIVVTSFGNGSFFDYGVGFGGTTPVSLQSFKID